jgi:transposase InsO family protein
VRLRNIDRLIFVWLYRFFPAILNTITVVKPETIIRWHRSGFRAYWRWKSRRCGGRPKIDRESRDLIRRMSKENPLWGAPRIHGELLMLGIEVAQSTVARYMTRRQGPPSQGWKTFLRNHAAGIASIDLFVVRTISFKLLYGLVILRHARRRLVNISVTNNPTAVWIAGQVTVAFPWDEAPRHLIRDRDRAFGVAYIRRIRAMGIRDHPTAPRSPWQNGHVERLIGSIRCESLDHFIVFGEAHLRGVLKAYASYYNEIRTHLSLDKDARIFGGRRSTAASQRYRSSAVSTINTSGFRFWIGTAVRRAAKLSARHPRIAIRDSIPKKCRGSSDIHISISDGRQDEFPASVLLLS